MTARNASVAPFRNNGGGLADTVNPGRAVGHLSGVTDRECSRRIDASIGELQGHRGSLLSLGRLCYVKETGGWWRWRWRRRSVKCRRTAKARLASRVLQPSSHTVPRVAHAEFAVAVIPLPDPRQPPIRALH